MRKFVLAFVLLLLLAPVQSQQQELNFDGLQLSSNLVVGDSIVWNINNQTTILNQTGGLPFELGAANLVVTGNPADFNFATPDFDSYFRLMANDILISMNSTFDIYTFFLFIMPTTYKSGSFTINLFDAVKQNPELFPINGSTIVDSGSTMDVSFSTPFAALNNETLNGTVAYEKTTGIMNSTTLSFLNQTLSIELNQELSNISALTPQTTTSTSTTISTVSNTSSTSSEIASSTLDETPFGFIFNTVVMLSLILVIRRKYL